MANRRKHRKSQNVTTRDGFDAQGLLAWHRLHAGVYARVARRLRVDASYVSRVASGQRRSPQIEDALIAELKRIQRLRPRV
jgi:transcriptional regulator with XRE-family HTH domain